MAGPRLPQVESFFDPATSTFSHLLLDPASRQCAQVDPVLDDDPAAGRTATRNADRLVERVRAVGAQVQWLLETHVHADHLSAAPYLQQTLGGRIAIGELPVPALLLPSVQVNMRAGRLPPPQANGMRHLKIPIDAF